MNKYLAVVLLVCGLFSCTPHDKHYYQMNPTELQKALKHCPEQSRGLSCATLQKIALKMNELAYELQSSPQNFGLKIANLQSLIISQEQQLRNHQDEKLKIELQNNQAKLSEYLAVVKWLESPMG